MAQIDEIIPQAQNLCLRDKNILDKTVATKKWLQNLSDEEWSAEREIVRQQFVHGDELAEYRLQKFDDEYERRKIEHYKHEPWTPPKHTEHGWYLSEKD